MKIKLLTLLIMGLLPVGEIYAEPESRVISGQNGSEIFELRFFTPKDGFYMGDEQEISVASTWSLNKLQQDKIMNATQYWANILTLNNPPTRTVLNVGTVDDDNAFAYSNTLIDNESPGDSYTTAQLNLQGAEMDTDAEDYDAHGYIAIGKLTFNDDKDRPGSISSSRDNQLTAITLHEIAHTLGISSSAGYLQDAEGNPTLTLMFDDNISVWSHHLYDDKDKVAQPGMEIVYQGTAEQAENGFDVRQDNAYFRGEHVEEVLQKAIERGTMKGVSVKIGGVDQEGKLLDGDFMSHIELDRSLMSHQDYRNYTIFMEAELAVLQDLGYIIDRKNMFGHSIYENDNDIINQQGYFQRNANGTESLIGQVNTASQGIGLHVYGKRNTITQQADLLAGGIGATGIRIDGERNRLTIDQGINVDANGDYGTGLLVAYGKDHQIIHAGRIRALGSEGIAARFDFGNNILGNETEYRGSYIRQYTRYYYDSENNIQTELVKEGIAELPAELKGSLVSNFDIKGELSGTKAAIYIAENALVDTINVLPGAQLHGDIISEYNQRDENDHQRLTRLNFGQVAEGRKAGTISAPFYIEYQGNIQGENNFALSANQGVTLLHGVHRVYSMGIAPGATLAGESHFTTNDLTNEGTLILSQPSNQINVKRNYTQSDTGLLQLTFNRQQASQLNIKGNAVFDGGLDIIAGEGWYAHNWSLALDQLINVDNSNAQSNKAANAMFAKENISIVNPSPIVSFTLIGSEGADLRLVASRAEDAYQRYTQDNNSQQIASALDRIGISSQLGTDLEDVYIALEEQISNRSLFNNSITQLGADVYAPMVRATLEKEQHLNRIVNELSAVDLSPGTWQGFASVVGAKNRQTTQQQQVGFNSTYSGLLVGAQTESDDVQGLTYGVHSVITHQQVKLKEANGSKGQSNHFSLGVHSRYSPQGAEQFYTAGLARIGIEKKHFDRHIQFTNYQQSNSAKWHGYTGSLVGEVGYRYPLNQIVELTPFANLEYSIVQHSGVTERGQDGSRLVIKRQHKNSLLGELGVKGNVRQALHNNTAINADLQLSWQHQLLDPTLTQTVNFAGYADQRFSQQSKLGSRDALGVKGGLSYELNPKTQLGIQAESRLFRSGYHSVAGNLLISYQF